MLDAATFTMLRDIGRDLFLRGLVGSHSGNMSVRLGRTIWITRRGCMLGRLRKEDMVDVDIERADAHAAMASSELAIHRAVYETTSALAFIHAHPPYATLLSMMRDEIIPVDAEGSYFFKKVPVVTVEQTIGSQEAGGVISEALQDYNVVMMKGHGSFAKGHLLEDAYMYTSSLEASSFYLYHMGDRKV